MANNTNNTNHQNKVHSRRFTVPRFADKYQDHCTESSLRFNIFSARSNGMDEFNVIERIGRRVLINEDNYFIWLEAINASTPPHKKSGV